MQGYLECLPIKFCSFINYGHSDSDKYLILIKFAEILIES
jgi:hypothetical protein